MPRHTPSKNPPGQLSLDDWGAALDTNVTERTAAEAATQAVADSRSESPVVAETASSSPSLLLTTRETAELLHVHPRTVQRLVERGQLGAIHLGAAVRFDPTDVAELTEQLKRYQSQAVAAIGDRLRPTRTAHVSFADRLRSQRA
jgi:excisionase family DNA binding protein